MRQEWDSCLKFEYLKIKIIPTQTNLILVKVPPELLDQEGKLSLETTVKLIKEELPELIPFPLKVQYFFPEINNYVVMTSNKRIGTHMSGQNFVELLVETKRTFSSPRNQA